MRLTLNEINKLEAEADEIDAFSEDEEDLNTIARRIFACFNLEEQASDFIHEGDGLAILVNCSLPRFLAARWQCLLRDNRPGKSVPMPSMGRIDAYQRHMVVRGAE